MKQLTLHLPDCLHAPLQRRADELGVPVADIVAALLLFCVDDEEPINRWRQEAQAIHEARLELARTLAGDESPDLTALVEQQRQAREAA